MSQALTLPTHPTLLHPITGQPLQALGHRRDGSLIWPIIGGSGEGDTGSGDGTGDSTGSGDGTGDNTGKGGSSNDTGNRGDNTDDGGDDHDDDGDEDKRVRRANKEAQRYRQELRQTEQRLDETQQQLQQQGTILEQLRKVFGGDDDGGGEGDPQELLQAAQTRQSELEGENRSLRVQLAVHGIAAEHDGNASALLDSRKFVGELDRLDPESDTFDSDVAEAVKSAVERDPKLRADQGSSRGGADLPGGSGEGSQRKPRGIRAAVGSRYGS